MGFREGAADLDNLAVSLVGAEVNRGADSGRSHVPGFLHGTKKDLVKLVGESEQFVVIDFYDEGNFVRVLAGHGAQHAESRSDGVAVALDGELDDIFAVEIVRILREAGAGGVLDALVDRENGHI